MAVGLPLAAVTLALPLLAGLMVYYTITFPNPLAMRTKERAPVIRILARDGSVLAERGTAHDYMPLDLLPAHVIGAVVAIEDRRFFQHRGLDPWGFARAVFANLRAGRLAQGGSTLTQQLAKNLFLTSERTFSRKLEELALALWLELRLSKSDILELYLNRVYFGAGAYGIEAASQRYFDKSARALSVAEAALIAGLLKAPSRYSPLVSPDAARSRGRIVVAKMAETGIISPEQEARAQAQKISFAAPQAAQASDHLEYAVDFVLERLPPLVAGGHSEIIVETTLDTMLQKRAGEIVASALARHGSSLGVSQAALVLLDTEGGIRALVGGRDHSESQFNRAVKARRQPGSAFKPFVFLAALERGLSPESVTYDLPLSISGWAPRNDNGTYAGAVTLRQALAQSLNTVAVRLNQEAGAGRTAAMARRLGIRSELRDDPSLALGTSEVTLMELTGTYATLSNGGMGIEPYAIRRVRLSSGRVVFAREGTGLAQLLDPRIAGDMNSMLNTALLSGTGKRAAFPAHPAAGKTGTTQEFRDAWFVGYTAHLAAGVWIGNDDGKPMNRASGGGLPASIWRELMLVAHQGKAPLALPGTAFVPAAAMADRTPADAAALPPSMTRLAVREPQRSSKAATRGSRTEPKTAQAARRAPTPTPSNAKMGEDLIARVIEENADVGRDAEIATAEPVVAPVQRERPRGMMSLGGWW